MTVSHVVARSVFAIAAFRRLYVAQVVALLGTGLLTVALALLAYDIAGSSAGAVLGTALAIKMFAYVVVAPGVSALTDRLPRRTVLVSADAVRLVVALLLPFVGQVWQIYVLIFLLQSASAAFTPTFQATIPSIVPDERQYTRALSLSRLAYDLESLLSPVLAAALLTLMSYQSLFVGTALGFVVSAVMVFGTRIPSPAVTERSAPFLQRTTAGVRRLFADPILRGLFSLNLVVASATGLVVVNTVVYVRELVGGADGSVAIALAFYGTGSVVVALAVPRILSRHSDRSLMLAGAGVAAVGTLGATLFVASGAAGMPGWGVLCAIWAVLGAGTSMINTPAARLLRRASSDSTRTSLFTAQFSLSHACFLVTYPIAGWVGAQVGQFAAAATLTVTATLAALTAARQWTRTRSAAAAPT